jgi:hypothetical protein
MTWGPGPQDGVTDTVSTDAEPLADLPRRHAAGSEGADEVTAARDRFGRLVRRVWDLLGLYGLVVALLPTAPSISCWSVVNPDWCWVIVAIKTRSGGSKHAQEDHRVSVGRIPRTPDPGRSCS